VHDDDADLVRRLRSGDEAAFAQLVRLHHAQLLRLASSLVSSRAVAEDAVQETWLGVVRGIDRFEGRASVKTWLFKILVNQARTAGAREYRSIPVDIGDESAVPVQRFDRTGAWGSPPAAWTDEADDRIDAKALAGQLRHLLPDLPAAQRQVFLLRDVEQMTSEEVCDLLELSEGNQRVLLHRARSRLRSLLEQEIGRV
jgi:RNA polymerase sigma-70 factor (ECF subfamily)